ncbi:MAG TPA: class I SAM-dependent rRNA methyltransferase [Polyangiaceae bacterium]|nr:class I SAM-dependent rRNA methyltransferase [Polyangiaceae bacterium]
MATVVLKAGHIQPVWAGHPWVYAQAVQRIEGGAGPGDEVLVTDPRGNYLGRGFYSPSSAIPVRILLRDRETPIDDALFRARLRRAVERRQLLGLPSSETSAVRIVNAEGDDLPGLVVDLFGEVAVVQIGTVGMKRREQAIFDAIQEVLAPRAIFDRTSAQAARAEKFIAGQGVVRGDPDVSSLSFVERGLRYELPATIAQKTGFYLDQRPMRGRIEQLAHGRRVLDAYSYVGAFAMAAARGGATEVTAVDESAVALEVGAECARSNGLIDRIRYVRGDARERMNQAGREGGYDLVLCDPPKFAPTRGARAGALGAYQKLAQSGCRATRPGGLLLLSSCSAAVGLDALTRALAIGAREVNVRATVLERFFQGFDHPVLAAFPEGLYLKSLLAVVEPL